MEIVSASVTSKIRKRDGNTMQEFDDRKIAAAIRGAWSEVGAVEESKLAEVAETAIRSLRDKQDIDVEKIQDAVETALMHHGQFAVAKAYILYRQKRTEARTARQHPDPLAVSNYIHAAKYARHLPHEKRREIFVESVERTESMHLRKFGHIPGMADRIRKAFAFVYDKRVLPSMRSLQFGGEAIEIVNNRLYNCSATHVDRLEAFSQAFYLLLCGCGVGYSVQFEHVDKLPEFGFINPKRVVHHVIADSIEGWADALKALLYSYVDGTYIEFSYHLIRAEGAPLKVSGGKAPGHIELKRAFDAIRVLLDGAQGRRLRPIEAHTIMCHAADAVLSGGIRRCLPAGTLVHTDRGLVPIESVVIGDYVQTHDGLAPVTDVIKQGVQELVSVKTQMGVFKCTAKHRMAVLTSPTTYEFKHAIDLEEGDRLVFVDHMLEGHETALPEWYYERLSADHTSVDITIPKLDTGIAWFIGYLHGNGYVHVNRTDEEGGAHFVSFSMNDEDLETPERIRRLHEVLSRFGVASSDNKVKGEKTRVVRASGKQLNLYLEKFKIPNAPLKIPTFILEGTPKIRSAYLAGLFDADGAANNRPVALVSSVYSEFLRQVQIVYSSLGIPTRLVLNREAIGEWQALYCLNLVGDLPRNTFVERVCPFAVKHIEHEYTSQRDYGYPRDWIVGTNIKYNGKWSPTNRQMTVSTFERCGGVRNGLTPITVFDVTETSITAETYDLTVDSVHEFVADGLLVHNSAMICLFSLEDSELMYCKTGDWFKRAPWFANANNSIILKRDEVKKTQFERVFQMTKQFGEPGFIFVADKDQATNPCAEISLNCKLTITYEVMKILKERVKRGKPMPNVKMGEVHSGLSFCNLCELNASKFKTYEDFVEAAEAATLIGTLQASYTDMPYLGWVSEVIAEREALLGVGMTGMMDSPAIALNPEYQREIAGKIVEWNAEFAEMIGIRQAARTTTVKPAGTTSLALGSVGSGHHPHHSRRYVRCVTANEMETVFQHFKAVNPHMCVLKPDGDWVIEFPVEAPEGALLKSDFSAIEFLDAVKSTQQNWVVPGTARPESSPGYTHNVSNTVSVDDSEWPQVIDYLWENRGSFSGVSFGPKHDKIYPFSPFQAVVTEADEARWNQLVAHYKPVDYLEMVEEDDGTKLAQEAACAGPGGSCEVVRT